MCGFTRISRRRRVRDIVGADADIPEILISSQKFGILLGLDRMHELLFRLGNPHTDQKFVHIAGTNGKGSVTTYIASMYAASGYTVGVYTSPYLERFSERIRILDKNASLDRFLADDREGEISLQVLRELSDRVSSATAEMLAAGKEHPTEFELVTAIAFLYFSQMKCDIVILETGLGGRLDSTNVIESPEFTVITALGYDHMDRLGDTIAQIAAEKAGIIKKGCPCYLYDPAQTDLSEEDAKIARSVVAGICDEKEAPLTVVSDDGLRVTRISEDGQTFSLPFFAQELTIRQIGDYQPSNAALAVRSMLGRVSKEAIIRGLFSSSWKGRMEVLCHHPLRILDGGHNPQGARVFCSSVNRLFSQAFIETPPVLILGFMKDKDYPQILSILFSSLQFRFSYIVCVTPNNPRALPAEELRNHIITHFHHADLFYKNQMTMYNERDKIFVIPDPQAACRSVMRDSNIPVLCLGSFYLAGQVRKNLICGLEENI